jgi:GT2 family glycosyltransferase
MITPLAKGAELPLKELTVVMLSYNRKSELEHSLPGYCEASAALGFELIVVDNASSDGSTDFLAALSDRFPLLRVVCNGENMGVARGRNVGWNLASGAFILNIDDDTRIEAADIELMLRAMKDNSEVGILSPRIIQAVTSESQCEHGEFSCHISNFHGACHLVRATVFRKVGAIDPECSFGGEELDYSIRTRVAGYDVIFFPGVTVRHNSLTRSGAEGAWRRRQWVFNFTRVFFKHFSRGRAAVLALRYSVSHIFSGGRKFGLFFAASLVPHMLRGAVAGRRQHSTVPASVGKFYANSKLRPEFGNVSIYSKLMAYFCS